MLLEVLLVSLARPSLEFALSQIAPGEPAQEASFPGDMREQLVARWAGERPWAHGLDRLALIEELAVPESETPVLQMLTESDLRVQAFGDVNAAWQRLNVLRAVVASESAHEETALRIALARAKLLEVLEQPEAAHRALFLLYPDREDAIAALNPYNLIAPPELGSVVDAARLTRALEELGEEWSALEARLRPAPQAIAAAEGAAAKDDAWLTRVLGPEELALLEDRFGAPSAAVAERVGAELFDGGAEHLANLGSVAVPALALYAIAGERALAEFRVDPVLRLNPLLELARLQPSAAYELIAELAPRRDAEWRQGAVGAYLRAGQGSPVQADSNWIRESQNGRLLQSRAPRRMRALAGLLADARTHGALRAELETLIALDSVPEVVAEAMGGCLLDLDEVGALQLISVLQPAGVLVGSTVDALRVGLGHTSGEVRERCLERVARSGDWKLAATLEDRADRAAMLEAAFYKRDGLRRQASLSLVAGLYQPDKSKQSVDSRARISEQDADSLHALYEDSGDSVRLAMLSLGAMSEPAFSRTVELALREGSPEVQRRAVWRWVRGEDMRTRSVSGVLPDDPEARGVLIGEWLEAQRGANEFAPERLVELPFPMGQRECNELVLWLREAPFVDCATAGSLALGLMRCEPQFVSDANWYSLYGQHLGDCGVDVQLLVHARNRRLLQLEGAVIRRAEEQHRLVDLLRGAESELGPGWWRQSADILSAMSRLRRDEGAAMERLRAGEILSGRVPLDEAIEMVASMAPYSEPASIDALIHLLEMPGADLGKLQKRTTERGHYLWWSGTVGSSAMRREVVSRVLTSEAVQPDVAMVALDWFDAGLPDSRSLAEVLVLAFLGESPRLPLPTRGSAASRALGSALKLLPSQQVWNALAIETGLYGAVRPMDWVAFATAAPADGRAHDLLLRILGDPESVLGDRSSAVRLLARDPSAATVEVLSSMLPSIDSGLRMEVREVLADIERLAAADAEPEVDETERVRLQLLEWIDSGRPGVAGAVQSLGSVGTVSDLPLLIELGLAEDIEVRKAANHALAALNGRLAR